jgi:hypothetical protein
MGTVARAGMFARWASRTNGCQEPDLLTPFFYLAPQATNPARIAGHSWNGFDMAETPVSKSIIDSWTIRGVVILLAVYVFKQRGLNISETEITEIITNICALAASLVAIWGRYRKGDLHVIPRKDGEE